MHNNFKIQILHDVLHDNFNNNILRAIFHNNFSSKILHDIFHNHFSSNIRCSIFHDNLWEEFHDTVMNNVFNNVRNIFNHNAHATLPHNTWNRLRSLSMNTKMVQTFAKVYFKILPISHVRNYSYHHNNNTQTFRDNYVSVQILTTTGVIATMLPIIPLSTASGQSHLKSNLLTFGFHFLFRTVFQVLRCRYDDFNNEVFYKFRIKHSVIKDAQFHFSDESRTRRPRT